MLDEIYDIFTIFNRVAKPRQKTTEVGGIWASSTKLWKNLIHRNLANFCDMFAYVLEQFCLMILCISKNAANWMFTCTHLYRCSRKREPSVAKSSDEIQIWHHAFVNFARGSGARLWRIVCGSGALWNVSISSRRHQLNEVNQLNALIQLLQLHQFNTFNQLNTISCVLTI